MNRCKRQLSLGVGFAAVINSVASGGAPDSLGVSYYWAAVSG